MKYKSSSSRSQKQKSHRRKSRSSKRRTNRRVQRGGLILTPSVYSNSNNSHFTGKGFTDETGAVTGCIGSPNSADALRGTNVDTIIGGVRTTVNMKGGQTTVTMPNGGGRVAKYMGGRRRSSCNKRKCNHKKHLRGGSHNTNGYSIGGVELKPSLSGIANNYHTAYDSCKV